MYSLVPQTFTHTRTLLRSTHQVFGGAQPLQPVQRQEVSRVLVRELGGLFEAPLLVQDGFIPDGQLALLRLAHGSLHYSATQLSIPTFFSSVFFLCSDGENQQQQQQQQPGK